MVVCGVIFLFWSAIFIIFLKAYPEEEGIIIQELAPELKLAESIDNGEDIGILLEGDIDNGGIPEYIDAPDEIPPPP